MITPLFNNEISHVRAERLGSCAELSCSCSDYRDANFRRVPGARCELAELSAFVSTGTRRLPFFPSPRPFPFLPSPEPLHPVAAATSVPVIVTRLAYFHLLFRWNGSPGPCAIISARRCANWPRRFSLPAGQ